MNKNLKQKLEQKKNRIGLVGTRLELNEVEGNSFSASITYDFRTISLNYGKDLNLIPDKETGVFAKKKKIANPKEKIGEDILEHETGHRENPTETRYGCPYQAWIHDRVKDSTARGLKDKGKQGLEDNVTNAFEDILDNVNCRRKTDFSGQTLFWNNQGLVNAENQKFNPFYEFFVKINLVLGGNVQDTTLLKRFYTNDEKVQKALKEFLNYFNQKLGVQNSMKIHEKPEFSILFNTNLEQRTELWEELAYKFAVIGADLLDKTPKEQMFGFEGENPFDGQVKIPKVKQEIAFGRYRQGKGASVYRDAQEQLYDLYKRISREIEVETSHFKDASKMPIVHFGRRFFKENDRKIRFRGIGIDENGEFGVKTTKHSIEYPVSYNVNPRKFPKLKIAVMDRSGSMALNPDNGKDVGDARFIPWGDNSKYHFALKGYVGIDNFFENQGIIDYIDSHVLGLSGEQVIRGSSEQVIKKLLVKPSGGTSLNVGDLEKEITEDSLTLSISDGEFNLNNDEKQRLKTRIENADYAHIQIGGETEFSKYLKSTGVPVFYAKGDEDLSRIMVNFVSDYYKSQPQAK